MSKPLSPFQKLVNREMRPVLRGKAFRAAIDSMSEEELLENWAFVFYLEGKVKARKERLHTRMLKRAKQYGSPYTDKVTGEFAGKVLSEHGTLVRAQRRTGATPQEDGIRDLLEKNAISEEEAFSKVSKVVLDPSKVARLVSTGKLDKDAVKETHKVNWALSVKVSPELYGYMEAQLDE
jgi:hypothetical protein